MLMPTQAQCELYQKLAAMFSRTAEFRSIDEGRSFRSMTPREAYTHIDNLRRATQGLRYQRLPRSEGLPRSQEERREQYRRALREERLARRVVPDENEWVIDTRPSAMDSGRSYLEAQDELLESIEMDRGVFRPLPTYLVLHVPSR